jgi:hypothetical protein
MRQLGEIGHKAARHLGLLAQTLEDSQTSDGNTEPAMARLVGELGQLSDFADNVCRGRIGHIPIEVTRK